MHQPNVAETVRKKVQDNSDVLVTFCITSFKNVSFATDSTDWQFWYAIWPVTTTWHCGGNLSRRWSQISATKNGKLKKFKAVKEIWSNAIISTLILFRAKEGGWIFFIHLKHSTLDVFCKHDVVCSMMKSQLDVAKLVPTRAAYNRFLQTIWKLPQNLALYQLSPAVQLIG